MVPQTRSAVRVKAYLLFLVGLLLISENVESLSLPLAGVNERHRGGSTGSVQLGTLEVAPIAFGTLNLPSDVNEASTILASLPRSTLLDTAEIYGPNKRGEVEQFIGSFRQQQQQQQKNTQSVQHHYYTATKFAPKPWRLDRKSLVSACKSSAERLNVKQIDLYQMHFPDPGLFGKKDEAYWEGIAECYHSGLVANVGMCNYGPTMIQRAHEALTIDRDVPLVSNQINFNLMRYRSSLESKQVCDALGIQVLGYHPLGNGVLTGKYKNVNETVKKLAKKDTFAPGLSKLRRVKWYQKHSQPVIDAVQQTASSRSGVSCAQVAINWTISKNVIPLTGVTTTAQMNDILGALAWSLTEEEVSTLDDAADASAEYAMGFELI
jgi:pyridoxine 4-dehydrogenase